MRFIMSLLIAVLAASSCAYGAHSILWTRGKEVPQPRSNPALAVYRNKLILAGGNDMKGATDTVQLFHLRRQKWEVGPAMAKARFAAAAVSYQKRVVVLGGYGKDKEILRSGESYTRRGWKAHPPMLRARARFGAIAIRRAIYVLGGIGADGKDLDSMELYQGGGWSEVPCMSKARNRLAFVELNNELYALGGEHMGKATDFAEVYALKTGYWRNIAPMPRPRKNFAAVAFRGKIIVAGGWQMINGKHKVFHNAVDIYCPKKNEWTTVEALPKGRDGVRAVAHRNKIYFMGGYDGTITSYVDIGQMVRKVDWKVDEEIGFHLATFTPKERELKRDRATYRLKEHPFVGKGKPDITNIALKGIKGLGFPLPDRKNEEQLTFYLKFYDYPSLFDHQKSARYQFDKYHLGRVKNIARLEKFVQLRKNILVKNGYIAKTGAKFDKDNSYHLYGVARDSAKLGGKVLTAQEQFDETVIFPSIYLQPRNRRPRGLKEGGKITWSAMGMLSFYNELLDIYESELEEVWEKGSDKHRIFLEKLPGGGVVKYSVLREPMVFHNARDLPMPHSKKHFLSSLLLVYRDEYAFSGAKDKKRTILEVGSVVRLH